ncbi:MAG: radical SAM protein, partial [Coriobacteriales bacterium]|nr:radical SAM protein [Coriobacteriales bacterium]
CPYRCSYCDWGSKTNLRVRRIPTELAKQEIRFVIEELRPWFMFWADANLGIMKRDVELAECFADCKKRAGLPMWLYYNNNKNSYESNLAIAKSFREAGLLTKYVLSVQHMDPEVLAAIGRTNLPQDQMQQLVRELYAIDYPIFTQLIAGCPQDTRERWLGAFVSLMELGVHGEYRAYPFGMFPNAPAADPEYQERWGVRVMSRPDSVAYFQQSKDLSWALSRSQYLVGASSYSQEDYERMWLLCWLIQAMHDHGLCRLVAIALRARGDVDYATFYRELFGWFYGVDGEGRPTGHVAMERYAAPMREHVHRWLEDETAPFMMRSEQAGGLLEPEEALCLRILFDADYFYEQLGMFLRERFDVPADLAAFQRDMIMRPDFDPVVDGRVRLSQRWVRFFAAVEADPFRLPAWPGEDSAGMRTYELDLSGLVFPVKPWFESKNQRRRKKAYYDQIVEHNVPGRRRTIFKRVQEGSMNEAKDRPSLEECKAAVMRDSRYSRVAPDDFPDEMWFTLYDRIVAERAQRRAVMANIRKGLPVTQVCMQPGSESLSLSDIIEALPGRVDSVADVMTDMGFEENCPLGYLPDDVR